MAIKHILIIYSNECLVVVRHSSMDHLKNTWRPLNALGHYNQKGLAIANVILMIYYEKMFFHECQVFLSAPC